MKLESAPHIEPYFEMRSWLAMQRGNFVLAEREVQTARKMAIERGRTYYQILDVFLLAEVFAERDVLDEAQTHIEEYRRLTFGMDGRLAEYLASLVEAYIALQQRDWPKCHARLRAALGIGSQQRYRSHWSWSPRMMVRLYEVALAHGIEVAYVRDVIKQHGMRPESPDTQNWPWPVKIRTLGHFEVLRDGEMLRFEGKAQRKPIEMAKMLVALGAHDIPVNKLMDLLWPEPSSGDAQKAFDITVHRLRRLLNCDEALQVTARTVSLNPQLVWVDVWALERRLAPLIPAVNAALPEIELLESEAQEVLNLYRGHFLAGESEESWQIALKNRLSGRFQRFVLRLGEHWELRETMAPRCRTLPKGHRTRSARGDVLPAANGLPARPGSACRGHRGLSALPASTFLDLGCAADRRNGSGLQAIAYLLVRIRRPSADRHRSPLRSSDRLPPRQHLQSVGNP